MDWCNRLTSAEGLSDLQLGSATGFQGTLTLVPLSAEGASHVSIFHASYGRSGCHCSHPATRSVCFVELEAIASIFSPITFFHPQHRSKQIKQNHQVGLAELLYLLRVLCCDARAVSSSGSAIRKKNLGGRVASKSQRRQIGDMSAWSDRPVCEYGRNPNHRNGAKR